MIAIPGTSPGVYMRSFGYGNENVCKQSKYKPCTGNCPSSMSLLSGEKCGVVKEHSEHGLVDKANASEE